MAQNLKVRDLQGATLDAKTDRLINSIMSEGWVVSGAAGVNLDSFKVVQQATPNMTVRVGSGVAGDIYAMPISTARGTYLVRNNDAYVGSGNSDVAIANGHATLGRIDGIDLKVWDNTEDSSGFSKSEVIVTQGTPGASPTAPAIPAGCVRLATVRVDALESTSIVTGDITDTRKQSAARGGVLVVASATEYPTPTATEGAFVYNLQLNQLLYWTGTAWQWLAGAAPNFRLIGGGAGQVVPTGAATTATWVNGSEVRDTEAAIAVGTGVFTCPAGMAGLWRFDASISFGSNATGLRGMWLEHSVSVTRYSQFLLPGAVESLAASADIVLAAGETVRVVMFQTSGGNLTTNTGSSQYFQGRYVGPT